MNSDHDLPDDADAILRRLGLPEDLSDEQREQVVAILSSDDSAEDKKNALMNIDIINNEGIHPDIDLITSVSALLKSLFG